MLFKSKKKLLVESDTFQSRRKAGGGGGSERAQGQFCFLLRIGVFSRKKQNPLLLRSVRSARDCAKNSGPGRARKEKNTELFWGRRKGGVVLSIVLLYSRCVSNEQATTKYIFCSMRQEFLRRLWKKHFWALKNIPLFTVQFHCLGGPRKSPKLSGRLDAFAWNRLVGRPRQLPNLFQGSRNYLDRDCKKCVITKG